jgi:hypothetical protein
MDLCRGSPSHYRRGAPAPGHRSNDRYEGTGYFIGHVHGRALVQTSPLGNQLALTPGFGASPAIVYWTRRFEKTPKSGYLLPWVGFARTVRQASAKVGRSFMQMHTSVYIFRDVYFFR